MILLQFWLKGEDVLDILGQIEVEMSIWSVILHIYEVKDESWGL